MSERAAWWLRFASFVAVAVLLVGPANLANPMQVGGQGVDLAGTIWIHWWVRTTVESFTLPTTTNLLFYPEGKNFFADTGANYMDAWLGVPLQWLFGVPGFLDPLYVVILVGNGLAFFALARDFTGGRTGPAWAATLAFLVNPFFLRQLGEGRPTQALLWFVILAIRYALRLREGSNRDAALFGLHTALAALTYWFNAYFIAFGLLPFVLYQLVRAPRVVAPRLAVAVGVTLAICAPFLWGIAQEMARGEVRRLQYTNWGDGPAASGSRWTTVADDLAGATWLAAIGLMLAAWRRSWLLALGVVVTLLLAVGAQVDLTEPMTKNWFFIAMWEHLPLYPRLGFPDRVTAVTFVLLALGVAAGLARLDIVWAPLFALVAVGEGLWTTLLPLPHTTYHPNPCADWLADKDGAVVMFPLASSESAMVLQTWHGRPMFGGMGEREPDLRPAGYERRLANTFLIALGATLNDTHTPIGYTLADREALVKDFRWAWYDRKYTPPMWTNAGYNPDAVLKRMNRELGEPALLLERCAIYDLSAPMPADPPGRSPPAKMASDELVRIGVSNVTVDGFGRIVPAAGPSKPGAVGVPKVDGTAIPTAGTPAAP